MEGTNKLEEQISSLQPDKPIVETSESVSYLGVRLPKAQDREGIFVPRRENYANYIHDEFALELQRDISVAFSLGQPLFIEGGTSIGKTTAIREMCSRLGWEVHYANLNYGADEGKLMGKPMPNTERKTPEDPEYVYWLGKVSSGLVPEEGKIKVIVLDEIGAAMPENLITLHEILDAMKNGEPVDLSEWGNGVVQIDPDRVRIVALTNPPGKGYFGRKPIDPALLRRFAYKKAASELPAKTFAERTQAMFGLIPKEADISIEKFITSRDAGLFPEQVQEIPGIREILDKYTEFHKGAKELVKNRQVGADQPQPFTFDDMEEPRRILDFVMAFYDGDINQTFQTALRYYYANKLESEVDRAKLEELIRHVEYVAPQNVSQRRGFERGARTLAEARQPTLEALTLEHAAWLKILGKDVEITPLPAEVTPEVTRNLEGLGFELRFIPRLDIGAIDDLKRKGEERYLDELQNRYPGWRRYESLSDTEREDHLVGRNLEEWYWRQVKDGSIDFPQVPGVWVAVETMPKPPYGGSYEKTPVTDRLGLSDRFSVSWNDAQAAIQKAKRGLLSEAGLPGSLDVRMLETLEWNLLANREGWGATDTYEWTNTEWHVRREAGGSRRVLVGYSGLGGAANVVCGRPDYSDDYVGFRVAVVLGF
jgi:MoxR-like ATPase